MGGGSRIAEHKKSYHIKPNGWWVHDHYLVLTSIEEENGPRDMAETFGDEKRVSLCLSLTEDMCNSIVYNRLSLCYKKYK